MKNTFLYLLSFLWKLIKYLLILGLGFFILSLILLASSYKNLQAAYQLGLAGKSDITNAIYSLQEKNWEESISRAESAGNNFNEALDNVSLIKESFLIKKIPFFSRQADDLEYLLKTTEILSRSLSRASLLAKSFAEINTRDSFAALSQTEKEKVLKLAYESEPELNGLKANLQIALLNMDKIHRIGILWPIYEEISEYKLQLEEGISLLENLGPLSKVMLSLGGYPEESNLLIILQNNDELRPSGGFIGTFGLATIKNGEILNLTTSDSYHLDMPAVGKWQKEPPKPIKKYLDVENWYLRDANWSPDWPTSAKQIQEIFTGESLAIGQNPPNFSAIVAINPDLIANLLTLIGPIEIENEVYTADNFQELLQYNVEVAYKDKGISSWDRKDVINDLLEELKTRLFNLNLKDWPRLIAIFNKDIAEKNIQIYFNNENLKFLSDNLGASGEVKKTDSDFLMVVDANLAAFKSDSVVKKEISYQLKNTSSKSEAELTLFYNHEGGFDWRTTRYRSYTRIYLPLGSRLISKNGFEKNTNDWLIEDDNELNKTVFSFFFSLEPGTNRSFNIKYQLPERIKNQLADGSYRLLVQKQSGRRTEKLNIDFNLQGEENIKWSGDLLSDKLFKP